MSSFQLSRPLRVHARRQLSAARMLRAHDDSIADGELVTLSSWAQRSVTLPVINFTIT